MAVSAETQAEIRSLRRKAARHRRNAAEMRLEHAARRGDPDCGQHGHRVERGIALGAIESHFYRQRDRGRSQFIEGPGDRRHG